MKRLKIFLATLLMLSFIVETPIIAGYHHARKSQASDWSDFAYRKGNVTQMIVGLKNYRPLRVAQVEEIAQRYGGKIVDKVSIGNRDIALTVELPLSDISKFIKEASTVASYIEPNWKWRAQLVPNDPFWSLQWGPQKIGAEWAWNITTGSMDVLVAVVDTGIDWDHPDLVANYVPLGYDWVNDDSNPMDDNGHGTHCAGIIAAAINNNLGIAGLAQVRIMAEKSLDREGVGYSNWLANGIIHAVNQGADIISMSWGGYYYSKLIHQAIKFAYDNGVLLVAAAGNEYMSAKLYPAGYDEVIAVSATDSNDMPASFSNYGDFIELAAPGVNIYSTIWNNRYQYASGTSMAAPHVAGVAALVWSRFPEKSRDWVRMWLRYTANDLGAPGFDIYYGYGRVNARNAVEGSPLAHDMAIYNWETPPYVEPEKTATINATILNFGESDESNVNVQLRVNNNVVASMNISLIRASESIPISLEWSPTTPGKYNVTLLVTPVSNETYLKNNFLSKYIYVGKPFKAVVLDSEGNYLSLTTRNWDILNEKWDLYGNVMIYIDYLSLRKQDITYADIAATNADMLIISSAWSKERGWEFTDSEIDAIKQYVEEGHGIIITEASFYYSGVPNNRKLASIVGLNESITWTYNTTYSLQLLKPQHPVLRKIPNPYYFPEVTTGISIDGVWDNNELAGGEYIAKGISGKSAIVVYKRGRTYISPWLEGIEPYSHGNHLQLLYNAITWSPHELSVSLEAPSYVLLNNPVLLNATAFNLGVVNEANVTLMLLINGTIVSSTVISNFQANTSYRLSYLWIPESTANYNITACVSRAARETFFANNVETRIVKVVLNRDVAVAQIISPDKMYAGKPVNITVVVANFGEFIETFNVTVYYDSTPIGTQTVVNLMPGTNITLTFAWNTAEIPPCRSYMVWAKAEPVPGEGNISNNVLIYGLVKVKMLGDVNGDGIINIYDVVMVAVAYGSKVGDPKWNPECDLVSPWNVINIFDVVAVASRYGKTC